MFIKRVYTHIHKNMESSKKNTLSLIREGLAATPLRWGIEEGKDMNGNVMLPPLPPQPRNAQL